MLIFGRSRPAVRTDLAYSGFYVRIFSDSCFRACSVSADHALLYVLILLILAFTYVFFQICCSAHAQFRPITPAVRTDPAHSGLFVRIQTGSSFHARSISAQHAPLYVLILLILAFTYVFRQIQAFAHAHFRPITPRYTY